MAIGSGAVRVLLVEDFQPFRCAVRSILGKRSAFEIVGEVSDGLEAVRKAEELQPDLILLDIGLPNLSGIDAARQIRKLAPEARIIFVTQESGEHFVQEAFRIGAMGYVVKRAAARNLLPAVDAVLDGKQFVSSVLSGPVHTASTD